MARMNSWVAAKVGKNVESWESGSSESSVSIASIYIIQQVSHPAALPRFSSAAPSLDLEHLITLHFQRHATFHAHPLNPLEELLGEVSLEGGELA
jgi:hypothetical protein